MTLQPFDQVGRPVSTTRAELARQYGVDISSIQRLLRQVRREVQ